MTKLTVGSFVFVLYLILTNANYSLNKVGKADANKSNVPAIDDLSLQFTPQNYFALVLFPQNPRTVDSLFLNESHNEAKMSFIEPKQYDKNKIAFSLKRIYIPKNFYLDFYSSELTLFWYPYNTVYAPSTNFCAGIKFPIGDRYELYYSFSKSKLRSNTTNDTSGSGINNRVGVSLTFQDFNHLF